MTRRAPPVRSRPKARPRPSSASEAPPVELDVQRLSAEGEGVAAWNGRALFVAGALPGERVRVIPAKEGKVRRGRLLEVLLPSPSG